MTIYEIFDDEGTAFIGDLHECCEFLEIDYYRTNRIRKKIAENPDYVGRFKDDNHGLYIRLYKGVYTPYWRDTVWLGKEVRIKPNTIG